MHRISLLLLLLLPALPLRAGAAAAPFQILPGQEASDTIEAEGADDPVAVGEGRAALDRDAEETLTALLGRLQGLGGVRVEVEAGLARLEGEVPSAEARDRAEEVARRIDGVSFVDNRIELSSSVTEQLGPAIERLEGRLGDILALLPAFVASLLALLLTLVLARWAGRLERPYAAFTDNPFLQNVLRQVVRGTLALGGVLVAVEILDVTALVGAVVGTAGVAGIALGFAFKDIVENYLAGLLLSLRQPFAPSDTVELEGMTGKVVRLTSRETILMDLNGNHVRIPNATVFRSVLTNFTRNPKRRFEVRLTVAPGEDLSRAMEVGRKTLRGMEGVLDDPQPTARTEEVGESWVVLVWYGWTDQRQTDFLKVQSEAIRLVLEALGVAGVDMPPPERRIRVVADDTAAVAQRIRTAGEGREGTDASTTPPPEPARRATPQRDVSPDRTLDAQIDEDRRSSDEEDLLG